MKKAALYRKKKFHNKQQSMHKRASGGWIKKFRISENNVIDNLKMQRAKSVERKVIFKPRCVWCGVESGPSDAEGKFKKLLTKKKIFEKISEKLGIFFRKLRNFWLFWKKLEAFWKFFSKASFFDFIKKAPKIWKYSKVFNF